jgi:hypothetical protein
MEQNLKTRVPDVLLRIDIFSMMMTDICSMILIDIRSMIITGEAPQDDLNGHRNGTVESETPSLNRIPAS